MIMYRHFIWLFISLVGDFSFVLAQNRDTLIIHFKYNRFDLDSSARWQLDSFLLASSPQYRVSRVYVSGHCDSIGSHRFNDSLSLRRAEEVKGYLTFKRIPDSLITGVEGAGKRQPVASNFTEKGRYMNRRVCVTICKEAILQPEVQKPDSPVIPTRMPSIAKTLAHPSIQVGEILILHNLNFYPGYHRILPQTKPILEDLLKAMKENPKLVIEIRGHVCCIPTDEPDGYDFDTHTYDLSWRRAKMVFDYLHENSIESSRMMYKGFGPRLKLNQDELTPAKREENRRVEIRIIQK